MYFKYGNIKDFSEWEYSIFWEELGANDKNKIKKLVRKRDKYLAILARYLLIKVLRNEYCLDYKKLDIRDNGYGKPICKDVFFNISHSNNYAIAAVGDNNIGVDIEYIKKIDISVINYCCTDREKNYILGSKNQSKAFLEIFCLKEAYFKMIGTGITNFKDVQFIINDGDVSCNMGEFNIKLNYDIDNYIIAIMEEI